MLIIGSPTQLFFKFVIYLVNFVFQVFRNIIELFVISLNFLVVFEILLSNLHNIWLEFKNLHYFNPITLLHLSLLYLVLKHQSIIFHSTSSIHVVDSNHLVSHTRHFMEMRRKKTKRIDLPMQMNANFPSHSESLASTCTSSELIY